MRSPWLPEHAARRTCVSSGCLRRHRHVRALAGDIHVAGEQTIADGVRIQRIGN